MAGTLTSTAPDAATFRRTGQGLLKKHFIKNGRHPFESNGTAGHANFALMTLLYGTSTVSSLPMKTKLGRLRPFMYLAAVCESAVTRMGSAMVGSQET